MPSSYSDPALGAIRVNVSSLRAAGRRLIAAAPVVRAELDVAILAAAKPMFEAAKANAGYSSQIPNSGTLKPTAFGATIKFDAPNASALENGGRGNPRHPLFGNRQHWYTNTTTPAFAQPARDAYEASTVATIDGAVDRALQRSI